MTLTEFGALLNKYHDDPSIHGQQGLGQYFCNRYNITDPELFFADYEKAIGIIMDNYLENNHEAVKDYEQDVPQK